MRENEVPVVADSAPRAVSRDEIAEYISASGFDAVSLAADLFCLLNTLDGASELSYSDPDLARKAIDGACAIEFPFLRSAVIDQIVRNKVGLSVVVRPSVTEKQVERFFFDNLQRYVPGACASTPPRVKPNLIPDGFLSLDGGTCPVEVKKGNFDSHALHQLLLYVHEYDAKRGIAVACGKATCAIPKNVTFVRVEAEDVLSAAESAIGDPAA